MVSHIRDTDYSFMSEKNLMFRHILDEINILQYLWNTRYLIISKENWMFYHI